MKKKKPIKSDDVPATQGMLQAVRDELKSDILSIRHEFKSLHKRFDAFDGKFASIDSRFDSMECRFDSIDRKFDTVSANAAASEERLNGKLKEIAADVHKIKSDCEAQEARNVYVLDGYAQVYEKEMDNDARITELEKFRLIKG